MESWVTSLLKDIKEKAGFSESSSSKTLFSGLLKKSDVEVLPTKDTSFDYFPSRLLLPELQLLIQYVHQIRLTMENQNLINILGRLLYMEHLASEKATFAPCLEFDMSKMGYACIATSLGERTWPPEAGYTFVCWFQCRGLKSQQTKLQETVRLRLFSVRSTNSEKSFEEEVYLQDNGVLTLATNNRSSLSSSNFELEEGKWYHLTIVQNKRDVVGAEHFFRIVHIYLNGRLIDSGEIASTPTLFERELQITIGTPASHARVSDLQWRLRSVYLFQEPLSADFIYFMYMLARGHKFLVQSSDNSDLNFNEDGEGERFAMLDADPGAGRSNSSESIWDIEKLEKFWSQLCRKKLLCAFNATRIEALPASQTLTLLNLVDPMSSDAIQVGMPSFGYLYGDVSMCRKCIIGNVILPVTEISIVLALIESAETSDTLHIALTLFASVLYQNPQSMEQMKACKGYELLSLFLYRKKAWFDIQCLQILFKIVVSEDPLKPKGSKTVIPSEKASSQEKVMEVKPDEFQDELTSAEHHYSGHGFYVNGDASNYDSDHVANTTKPLSISGALSDADIVEHVFLNWALWVSAPVSIQLEILNFFENLISVYKYKDHNLAVLRERNIVQHFLTALHRDDVETLVQEKFVILLGIILEHKFLGSELESVTTFVLTTFDPPDVVKPLQVVREDKSKRVSLRNIILEMLIDLQVIISSKELLEQWHRIVSSKLITFFLDEVVHPSSIIWIITLLGLCLTSSPVFSLKFESSGGYQTLARVLSTFHDFLDIYYTIFCIIFRKPIYPKLPEVIIADFETLMLNNEDLGDLKHVGLLDSVVGMVKSTFDQLRVQSNLAQQAVKIPQASVVEHSEENADIIEESGSDEASRNKTYTRSSIGWEPSTTNAALVLKYMANLAKMSSSFSIICERTELLESCVDLYFSIKRSYMVEKLTSKPNSATTSSKSSNVANENDDFPSGNSVAQILSTENSSFLTASHLMCEMNNCGYSGEPTSVGATSTLDLISELLSATLVKHISPVAIMENLLWSAPLYLDSESVLTFQALILSRVMVYLERRLLHNDVKNGQNVDTLWSNIGLFCKLLVESVYMGVFPRPSDAMRVLEFCFLMLHSAEKDGQFKESSLPWSSLMSILKGTKSIDVILKSTNQMILYFFLPSSLTPIREDPLISREEIRVDICIILELIHAHKEIIFHPSNVDTDLYCSLCVNLLFLFNDPRVDVRSAATGILKYLLVHCRAPLESVLISKSDYKLPVDVLNGGFDKLLTENTSAFMRWFESAEHEINQVLQQFAGIRWSKFIAESVKFRRERFGLLEDRWTAKMGQKLEHASKAELVYWDQYIERRSTLAATRITTCTELELAYGKKCASVVHAESEWRSRFEQLRHVHKVELISSLVWEDYWPL